jgi:hypothetical protein
VLDAVFGRSVSVVLRKTATAEWRIHGFALDIIDLLERPT